MPLGKTSTIWCTSNVDGTSVLDRERRVVPADSPEAYSWIETKFEGGIMVEESWGLTDKALKEFDESTKT